MGIGDVPNGIKVGDIGREQRRHNMKWERFSKIMLKHVCYDPQCDMIGITGQPIDDEAAQCQKCKKIFELGLEYGTKNVVKKNRKNRAKRIK